MSTDWTNSHHLQLFYYVVRNGGITQAARAMPYGIQQPAVSEAMAELEGHVGAKLFRRSPFALTPAGQELFDYVDPFFSGLSALVDRLRHPDAPHVRIGVSEFLLHQYLPPLMVGLRQRAAHLRFSYQSRPPAELVAGVKNGAFDVAIAGVNDPPDGLEVLPLAQLPLVLLTPARQRIRVEELLRPGRLGLPLICPGAEDGVSRHFQRELARRKITWPPMVGTNSISFISWFVGDGHGLGVTVDLPVLVNHPKLAVLPLEGFRPLEIVALSRRDPSPPVALALDQIRVCAAKVHSPRQYRPPLSPVPLGDETMVAEKPLPTREDPAWAYLKEPYEDGHGSPFGSAPPEPKKGRGTKRLSKRQAEEKARKAEEYRRAHYTEASNYFGE